MITAPAGAGCCWDGRSGEWAVMVGLGDVKRGLAMVGLKFE